MRPVTERSVLSLLTITEPNLLGLLGDIADWPPLHYLVEINILTGEITERLLSPGQTTAAPGVATPRLHRYVHRLEVVDVAGGGRRGLHPGHFSHGIIKFGSELWPRLLRPPLGWSHRTGGQETFWTQAERPEPRGE